MFSKLVNTFINGVEISEQEAVYLVLKMPLHMSSRQVVFIATSPSPERVTLLKSMTELLEMETADGKNTDVTLPGAITRSVSPPLYIFGHAFTHSLRHMNVFLSLIDHLHQVLFRYDKRPDRMKHLCLAEVMSHYNWKSNKMAEKEDVDADFHEDDRVEDEDEVAKGKWLLIPQ